MSTNTARKAAGGWWPQQARANPRAGVSPGRPTPPRIAQLCRAADDRAAAVLQPVALAALRVLLGLLFVWFGGLKVAGASPVEVIVAGTLPWLDPAVSVTALGGVEVALGAALVCGVAVRLVLPALATHLAGTFLTFLMLPELMFREHNPLLLTESGEFVTKNLVLIAATLVLIAHTRQPSGAGAQDAGPARTPRAA